ncbi:terminase gpA endonuclease subunit [Sphingomonas sp. NFR15]|uniref:terminase gpA endonuclease subunit n=1 Tax=Sphingomonas sp. NFR15 TaxID=1566282 RepID=UPI00087FA4C7|nr:terminase gpA endonuclease subunit [Sphingomonas sp. NFR15]SDA15023.1 Phage terminase, large subunit GpA [Sphingomonas sp. NFR15]
MDALEEVGRDLDRLSRDEFCADPVTMAREALQLLTPPEDISTTDCAARYRYIPHAEGTGASLWNPDLTPYMLGPQEAGDDPATNLIIVPKPGRVGGTIGAENILFKRLKFGPVPDVLWYLGSDSERDSYIDRTVTKIFELHPDIQAKVGKGRSDDKRTFKRIAGRILEYLQINARTITGRTGGLIVVDEVDSARPKLRNSMIDQMLIRGTTVGTRFKGYVCSHMDAGWTSGVAAAWKESSRGIWYWPCPDCGGFSSPCPTAPKGWRTTLFYVRLTGVSDDEMFDHVAKTAGLSCPHCGSIIDNEAKRAMNAAGKWVHEGQSIDVNGNVTGEPRSRKVMGFWIHGAMSPWVSWADLARRYISALVTYERTKRPERLREVSAKVLGEIYEGADGVAQALDAGKLEERAKDADGFKVGTVPSQALFVTAAVDPGGSKFDVGFWGWDLEGRSWLIDRVTLKQRRWPDGVLRDLRPAERIDDWNVLRTEVLDRLVPLADDPDLALPVAAMTIDTGDGHVTWKAREFARRMSRAGYSWGKAQRWERVRLIKGSKSPAAPELPPKGREVSVDEMGKSVLPVVLEFDLGVHKLKTLSVERVATTDGGPGQCYFARGLPKSTFAEFSGEVLIDDVWERRGPNETLDLFGYAEAARLMLRPDRADIDWIAKRPVWAKPVRISVDEIGQPAPAAVPVTTRAPTARERMAALNRRK